MRSDILLTFSANWSDTARAMYPQQREMLDRLGEKRFAILSVNRDRERETLRQSLKDGEITWPCWWGGPTREIPATFMVCSARSGLLFLARVHFVGIHRFENS